MDTEVQLHFISGMPSSGSILLSGILNQNPDFHARLSSPVGSLINGVLEQIGAGSEFYTFIYEDSRAFNSNFNFYQIDRK